MPRGRANFTEGHALKNALLAMHTIKDLSKRRAAIEWLYLRLKADCRAADIAQRKAAEARRNSTAVAYGETVT